MILSAMPVNRKPNTREGIKCLLFLLSAPLFIFLIANNLYGQKIKEKDNRQFKNPVLRLYRPYKKSVDMRFD
jgi:hypothetical protein